MRNALQTLFAENCKALYTPKLATTLSTKIRKSQPTMIFSHLTMKLDGISLNPLYFKTTKAFIKQTQNQIANNILQLLKENEFNKWLKEIRNEPDTNTLCFPFQ